MLDAGEEVGIVLGLFLFKDRFEAFEAGVAEGTEGAGVVGDGFPVGVDEGRWFGKFVEDGGDGGIHGGGARWRPALVKR